MERRKYKFKVLDFRHPRASEMLKYLSFGSKNKCMTDFGMQIKILKNRSHIKSSKRA